MFPAAAAMVVLAGACSDVDDHVAAGRYRQACERARRHPDERPSFETWVAAHAQVATTTVDVDEVTHALGGPVRGLGTDVRLLDVRASLPGAVVEIERPSVALPEPSAREELVARLPPLVQLARAPHLALVDPADLAPSPWGSAPRGHDLISDLLDVAGAVGMGVGAAVGVAVAVPVGLLVGAAEGFGSFLDAIFGGGGGGAPPLETRVAPVTFEEPVDQRSLDALLRSPSELLEAQPALDAAYARHVDAVGAERARRVTVAQDPALLGLADAACARGACRMVLRELPERVHLVARFVGDVGGAGGALVPDTGACSAELEVPFPAPPPSAPASSAPASSVAASSVAVPTEPATPGGPELMLTTSLDAQAPAYWLDHPAALSRKVVRALPGEVARTRIDDLVCAVQVKRARVDPDGSAGDLLVRVAAGRVRARIHAAFLGKNLTDAQLKLTHLALVPGERLRLSLASAAGASLGGAIVDVDGHLPLVLQNDAFVARCTEPVLAEGAVDQAARAASQATEALRALAPASGGVADARALVAIDKARTRARAAVVQLGALVGWGDARAQAAVAALRDADPLPTP